MKIKYLTTASVILAGAATIVGCQNLLLGPKMKAPAPPSMTAGYHSLAGMRVGPKLGGLRSIQAIASIPAGAKSYFGQHAAVLAQGSYSLKTPSIAKLSSLESQGLFKNAAFAPDSVVAVFDASGTFVKNIDFNGKHIRQVYSRFVVLFDPSTGLPVAEGLFDS